VTIDHQSKEDQTVTIRYRDSMQQERVPIATIRDLVRAQIR
jgi:glycyl-tRNA synthetase